MAHSVRHNKLYNFWLLFLWLEINRLLRECLDLVMAENFILQISNPKWPPELCSIIWKVFSFVIYLMWYSLYNQLWATWSVPLNVYSPSAIIAFSLLNSILMARFLKQSFTQTCLKETDNGKLHQFNYWNESTLHTWAGKRAIRRRGS